MRASAIAPLLALGGCVPTYLDPEAEERTYSRKAEEVWAAAIGAAQELDLMIDADEHDSRGGRVDARYAEGDPIRIDVRSVAPDRTTVSVRGRSGTAGLLFDREPAGPAP